MVQRVIVLKCKSLVSCIQRQLTNYYLLNRTPTTVMKPFLKRSCYLLVIQLHNIMTIKPTKGRPIKQGFYVRNLSINLKMLSKEVEKGFPHLIHQKSVTGMNLKTLRFDLYAKPFYVKNIYVHDQIFIQLSCREELRFCLNQVKSI